MAAQFGWEIRALLFDDGKRLSTWAHDVLDSQPDADAYAMAPELLAELGEKDDSAPELVAVAAIPSDDLNRVQGDERLLAVGFDRPSSPGNIGNLARSADALGASAVIVTGHAADPYDPKSVRASTGSIFALPVLRQPSHHEVLGWVADLRGRGVPVVVAGTDERGDCEVAAYDFSRPTLVVIGNETAGMSTGWRNGCDTTISIPIAGSASSLNAVTAAAIVLYEAARQRRAASTS
jgi:TrmH family RNA methyltransferase